MGLVKWILYNDSKKRVRYSTLIGGLGVLVGGALVVDQIKGGENLENFAEWSGDCAFPVAKQAVGDTTKSEKKAMDKYREVCGEDKEVPTTIVGEAAVASTVAAAPEVTIQTAPASSVSEGPMVSIDKTQNPDTIVFPNPAFFAPYTDNLCPANEFIVRTFKDKDGNIDPLGSTLWGIVKINTGAEVGDPSAPSPVIYNYPGVAEVAKSIQPGMRVVVNGCVPA